MFQGRIYQLTSSPTPSIKLSFGEQPNRNSPILRSSSTWGNEKTYTTWHAFSESTVVDDNGTLADATVAEKILSAMQ
ncbi:MAG: hypothetical protein ACI4P8_03400 [Akkermansia sp.]